MFNLHLKELWNYRDLLMLFVRRDFIAIYKQTILGPLWHVIQFGLLIVIYLYFVFNGYAVRPNEYLAALPVLILVMAMLGLGFGIIISSLTTKYRDLSYFVGFGTQLLMYATPVIYPISTIPEKYQKLIYLNPMAPVVEGFKYSLTGAGTFNINMLIYSLAAASVIFIVAILLFNRVENRFVDTL